MWLHTDWYFPVSESGQGVDTDNIIQWDQRKDVQINHNLIYDLVSLFHIQYTGCN
jgi:hypothetical protein